MKIRNLLVVLLLLCAPQISSSEGYIFIDYSHGLEASYSESDTVYTERQGATIELHRYLSQRSAYSLGMSLLIKTKMQIENTTYTSDDWHLNYSSILPFLYHYDFLQRQRLRLSIGLGFIFESEFDSALNFDTNFIFRGGPSIEIASLYNFNDRLALHFAIRPFVNMLSYNIDTDLNSGRFGFNGGRVSASIGLAYRTIF